MKRRNVINVLLGSVAVLTVLLCFSSVQADEIGKLSGEKFAQLARGGILYDNWPEELGIKIDKTHPSYPADGKQKGEITWRCKECHGWDYKGKAGSYSSGSHYTGIVGIRAYANQKPDEVLKILRDERHAFVNVIPDESLEALSLFVAYGQVDTDLYINRTTRKSTGEASNGERIFLTTCTKCHGKDGKEMNFGSANNPEYIGTLARENPWEALHKIRWGNPGTQMVTLLFLDLEEQLDVLFYCQTLPEK